MPDQPYAPRVKPDGEFHCIADAKGVIAKVMLMAAQDDADEIKLYNKDQTQAILKAINEDPPPTDYKSDTLLVLLHHAEEGGAAMIFFVNDECITGNIPKIPMAAWMHIISKSIGDDS